MRSQGQAESSDQPVTDAQRAANQYLEKFFAAHPKLSRRGVPGVGQKLNDDGKYGWRTERVMRFIQRAEHRKDRTVKVDGKFGSQMRDMMQAYTPPAAAEREPDNQRSLPPPPVTATRGGVDTQKGRVVLPPQPQPQAGPPPPQNQATLPPPQPQATLPPPQDQSQARSVSPPLQTPVEVPTAPKQTLPQLPPPPPANTFEERWPAPAVPPTPKTPPPVASRAITDKGQQTIPPQAAPVVPEAPHDDSMLRWQMPKDGKLFDPQYNGGIVATPPDPSIQARKVTTVPLTVTNQAIPNNAAPKAGGLPQQPSTSVPQIAPVVPSADEQVKAPVLRSAPDLAFKPDTQRGSVLPPQQATLPPDFFDPKNGGPSSGPLTSYSSATVKRGPNGKLVSGVDTALPEQGPGYVTYHPTHIPALYGTPRTIEMIKRIAKTFYEQTGENLFIGDISRLHGGPIGDHHAHRNGNNVDFDIRFKDGLHRDDRNSPNATWRSPQYDRAKTQYLVNLIRYYSGGSASILNNDPHLRGVHPYPNHDNHLHAQGLHVGEPRGPVPVFNPNAAQPDPPSSPGRSHARTPRGHRHRH